MNGHSRAFLLPEVYRLFPESEGVSGGVFEDVLPFEFISVFLLACIVGAIVVACKEKEDK